MNFGFDIDDTITAEPAAFRALMEALVDAGHEVHVITGVMPSVTKPEHATYEGRRAQLEGYGILEGVGYTKLHLAAVDGAKAIARQKRQLCEQHEIALMFEDRSDYANEVRQASRCLLMWP